MTMHFNVAILEEWLAGNSPRAIDKLAVSSRLSVMGIYKIRKGKHLPRVATIKRLAKAMKCAPEELVVIKVRAKRSA